MKVETVTKKIVYIALVLYILDIIILGGGNLTKTGSFSTRILFFAIAILFSIPGLLKNYRNYIKNKYCIIVGVFMILLVGSLAVGIINGNNRGILLNDFKGFLNILIVFPMLYVIDTKENAKKIVKLMSNALVGMAGVALALTFYAKLSSNTKSAIYHFLNDNVICSLTALNSNVTRVFFHTSSRLFFVAFLFLLMSIAIEPKKKHLKEIALAILMSVCFVSYTRSIYLGIFVCFVIFVVSIGFMFKEHAKQYCKSVVRMIVLTLVIVLSLGFVQNDNLISVAITRCLLSVQPLEEIGISEGENVVSDLENLEHEINNLSIREQRKKMALGNFAKSPIWGSGLGVENDPDGKTIEYFYFDLLSKMGVLGMVTFLAPIVFAIYDFVNYKKKYTQEQALLLFASIASTLFMMVISYFNPCMNTSVGLMIYGLMIAMANLIPEQEACRDIVKG